MTGSFVGRLISSLRTLSLAIPPLATLVVPNARNRKVSRCVYQMVGRSPANLGLYQLAFKHVSVAKRNRYGLKESNERLEYLGDAVLSTVVAEYLFKKFPFRDEGFLTEIRARIVNRESLNEVARKIGVDQLVEYDSSHRGGYRAHKSINGNTLEALVGAVYLDHGFTFCRRFILNRILIPHFDLSKIVNNNTNYKSMIIEWAQKNNHQVHFEIVDTRGTSHQREFIAQLFLDEKPICQGSGYSKKKAEQRASEKAIQELEPEFE
ncbi:MAG: ribonuclease III [Tunicatimonas sp.]|uniref:ribonuclease III n=1 Tax=Tunicatimonas sp. TaxID=1940096 RepID=UPI003C769108